MFYSKKNQKTLSSSSPVRANADGENQDDDEHDRHDRHGGQHFLRVGVLLLKVPCFLALAIQLVAVFRVVPPYGVVLDCRQIARSVDLIVHPTQPPRQFILGGDIGWSLFQMLVVMPATHRARENIA